MVHVIFDIMEPSGYFTGQQGGAEGDLYRNLLFQRGYGVGTFLSRGWRWFKPYFREYGVPLIKGALSTLTETGGEAVSNVLKDVLADKDPKEAIVTHGTDALKKISRQAGNKLTQLGSGRGKKRKRKSSSKSSLDEFGLVGRSVRQSAAKKKNQRKGLGQTLY